MSEKLSTRYSCSRIFCGNRYRPRIAFQLKVKEPGLGYTTQWLCHDCVQDYINDLSNQVRKEIKLEREARKKVKKK